MSTLASVFGYGLLSARAAASVAGRFYYATDTTLMYRDNGSSWDPLAVGAGSVATDTIWSAAGDLVQGTGSHAAARLGAGTAGYVLTAAGAAASVAWAANPFAPWLVEIVPMIADPTATTGTWALGAFADNAVVYPFVKVDASTGLTTGGVALFNSSAAQNDAISYKVALSAGTWDATFHVRKSTNTGIITLNQDGASQGTVDTYAAAAAYGKVQITGWTVATDGAHTMQLKAATKNASSSGYILELFGISLRRTA